MKKLLGVMSAYIVCAFAICLGVAALSGYVPLLLTGAETKYRLVRGIIIFFDIFPAVVASGFLVSCSISFGRNSGNCPARFSPVIFSHYKNVMICSICLALVLSVCSEILNTFFEKQQRYAKEAPYLLAEYISLGKQNFAEEKNALAHEYARHALSLSPKNEEAKDLIEKTEALINAIKPGQKNSSAKLYSDAERSPETVSALIKKSETAAAAGKLFDAHYYAQMAIAAGTDKDINLGSARRCAAEAWNKLSAPSEVEDTQKELYFKRKRDAYIHLIQGDVLESYYRFLAISEESKFAAADPDVVRYLGISKEELSSQYFFVDETSDLQKFESASNIYFRLKQADNSVDVFYIHGITPVVRSGNMVQYLRGLSVYSYDRNGKKISSFEVPYAKMLVQSVSLFGDETKQRLGIDDSFKKIPYILLESVGRTENSTGTDDNAIIRPSYEYADNETHHENGFMILPMPFKDFEMICEASIGADKMNLISLLNFVPIASSYGFSEETFNTMLIKRFMYPLLILILLVFFASAAWNYRIGKKQVFKFKWIIVLPLSAVVAYFILKALSSIINIINYVIVAVCGQFALTVSFVLAVIFLIIVSIIFLGRTSD